MTSRRQESIQCEDVPEHMIEYLNGDLPGALFQFEQHLRVCDACRTETEELEFVWDLLGSFPAAEPSPDSRARFDGMRNVAINNYDLLAHYVELNCNDDMATFLLSGFQAKPSTKTLTPPVSDSIRKVKPGAKSGEVDVTLLRFKGAISYELRWAPVPPGGAPTAWVRQPVPRVRPATTISALTPGTTYAFQVHALLKKGGFTDWSDSVTIMCT